MRSSAGLGAMALVAFLALAASPWGRERVARERAFFDAFLFFVQEYGFERAIAAVRGEQFEQTVDLRARTPEQVIAGSSTPRDPPPLVSCLGGPPELEPEAERRAVELLRRGQKALPALTKALSSKEPDRVRFALITLRRGGLPVPEAVPALDRLLSDERLGDDAARVLWNSGERGRAVIENTVFYAPPLPDLPRQGEDSPAARKVHEIFDLHIRREKAAKTPLYADADGALEILRRALLSGPYGARHDAAYLLGLLKERKAEGVAVLIEALERETDSTLIGSLEQLGPDALAAVPLLRRLSMKRGSSEDAAWALFAVTGSDSDRDRLLTLVEAKDRLSFTNLDTFVKACPRSPRARAFMERAYGGGDYRDQFVESRWENALRECLGNSLTPKKQALLDARHEAAVKAQYEKGRDR